MTSSPQPVDCRPTPLARYRPGAGAPAHRLIATALLAAAGIHLGCRSRAACCSAPGRGGPPGSAAGARPRAPRRAELGGARTKLVGCPSRVPRTAVRRSTEYHPSSPDDGRKPAELAVDSPAGGDVLLVLLEQAAGEGDDPRDTPVGDPVVDRAMVAARRDEAAPAKAREVVRNVGLGNCKTFDQLPDRELVLGLQQLDDPEPGRMGEDAEVLGEELGPGRRVRNVERRFCECGLRHEIASRQFISTLILAHETSREEETVAERLEVRIAGMTCDDCARHVADAFERAGAREVDGDWRTGRAQLDRGLSEEQLAGALE